MFQLGDNVKNVSSSIYDYAGYTVGAGEMIVASVGIKHLFSGSTSHQDVGTTSEHTFDNRYLLLDFFARVVRVILVLEVVVDLLLVP